MADEEIKAEDPAKDEEIVKAAEAPADDQAEEDSDLTPEEGIKDLKRNLEELKLQAERDRHARAEAEKLAYSAQIDAHNERMIAAQANYQSIKDGISFLKGREGQVMEAWKEAKSMGDYQREAELQREMYQMQMTMERLEDRRGKFEQFLQNPPQPVAPPPPQQDPVEAFASEQSPPTAAWVRRNREFLSDETNKHLVAAAHHRALAGGYSVDTPEYFRAIEEDLGIRKPLRRAEHDVGDEEETYSRRPAPPPSAPVSRGGNRKGAVTLSASEREAAEMSGISYEEYYRQQQKIKAENRQGGTR